MTASSCQYSRNIELNATLINRKLSSAKLLVMRKKQRKKIFLISSVVSLVGLITIILFLPPTFEISFSLLSLPIIYISFILIFLFLYSLTAYVFKSFIHGILVGLFPITYLILRLNDLRNPIFFILLLGLFIAMEILLVQMTKKNPL